MPAVRTFGGGCLHEGDAAQLWGLYAYATQAGSKPAYTQLRWRDSRKQLAFARSSDGGLERKERQWVVGEVLSFLEQVGGRFGWVSLLAWLDFAGLYLGEGGPDWNVRYVHVVEVLAWVLVIGQNFATQNAYRIRSIFTNPSFQCCMHLPSRDAKFACTRQALVIRYLFAAWLEIGWIGVVRTIWFLQTCQCRETGHVPTLHVWKHQGSHHLLIAAINP
jgi:hypothetical protein